MTQMISLPPHARFHIIGIGGAGMSAIAVVLMERGYQVSGSDQTESDVTRRLNDQGAQIYIGHRAENVGEAAMVIASSAVREENIELVAARSQNIPVSKRAQILGWLMQGSTGMAVAGTHGKTTT
ncbi:MAG TPA: Mur ligase domain-containing protein, partial [Anaerolineae bacterium]|nr:Mur ligase domain-containing protein [Anaerolineae bacterium]